MKKRSLKEELRKLRFGKDLVLEVGIVKRDAYGFVLNDAWIGATPSEAERHLRNFEEDPYDEAPL